MIAEAFHPSEYIKDELEARGWSISDLAKRIPGDYGVNHLAIEMYLDCGPEEPDMRMGDMAEQIATAFGVSCTLFRNLENAWLAHFPSRQS